MKLSNISVENSTGYGLFGINVLGNSSISHSRFIFNNYYTLNSTANCSYGLRSCQGGNIQLKYQRTTDSVVMVTESVHVMNIDSCVFEDGVDISELEPVPRVSSGLAIYTYFHYSVQEI